MARNVGIFIFDEVEVLDFAGPFEVFAVASRVKAGHAPGMEPPFKVFTVGRTAKAIEARGALSVTPHFSFRNHPVIDLLVIPGGVVTAELRKEAVVRWIADTAAQAKTIAGICTGSFLLAQAGLLEGKRATTHWQDIGDLRSMFPRVTVEEGSRWVEQGNIVTSAGISAGIDLSLHLVAQFEGQKLAADTARQMDYHRSPSFPA